MSDDWYAENIRSPFAGGATILATSPTVDAHQASRRTAAPAPRADSTAAHCYALGATVYTSSWHSGTSISGTVTQRAHTSYVDAEFVSGSTYAGSIYVTDTTTKRISGAYFPAAGAGNLLCFAGSTNGVICDNAVITYQGEYCGATGCNSDLIALRGGTSSQNG